MMIVKETKANKKLIIPLPATETAKIVRGRYIRFIKLLPQIKVFIAWVIVWEKKFHTSKPINK
jgi:hypothetical protein